MQTLGILLIAFITVLLIYFMSFWISEFYGNNIMGAFYDTIYSCPHQNSRTKLYDDGNNNVRFLITSSISICISLIILNRNIRNDRLNCPPCTGTNYSQIAYLVNLLWKKFNFRPLWFIYGYNHQEVHLVAAVLLSFLILLCKNKKLYLFIVCLDVDVHELLILK